MKNIVCILFLLPALSFSQNTFIRNDNKSIWLITASFPNIGEFRFYASAGKNDTSLVLQSFEDRDKFILGNIKALAFRMLQKRDYKKSLAALELNNSNGKISSIFGSFSLKEIIKTNNFFEGNIYDKGQTEKVGSIKGEDVTNAGHTYKCIANYSSLADTIIKTTSSFVYNSALIQSKNWTNFCATLQNKSNGIYDDVEFLTLFFANAKSVGFSHFLLTKEPVNLGRTINDKQINCTTINDSTVVIKPETLSGRKDEIDSVFGVYKNFKIIILDLRNTPGGNIGVTSYLASYLIRDTVDAGYFVTRKYFLNKQNFADMETLKSDEVHALSQYLEHDESVHIILYPDKNENYNRRLFVLINNTIYYYKIV